MKKKNKDKQDENQQDEQDKRLVLFEGKGIRREWHNNEWHFSAVDIVAALTASVDSSAYWRKLKQREPQLVTICHALRLMAEDGKMRLSDCVNRKNALRLIQSIPSKKAEPFKMWLAQVGEDRLQEIEDPELGQARIRELYRLKGYSDEWIGKRMRGMEIRKDLTDEWKQRDVQQNREFAILTNEISKAAFGKTVNEYKQHKSLRHKDNLRDHMDEMELLFMMLGEKVTTKITQKDNAQGFNDCKTSAKKGGKVVGESRRNIEAEIGESIVKEDNYLDMPEKEKRKLLTKKKGTSTAAPT